MNIDEIKQLLKKHEIKLTDIPSIDLYMDQITTFMEDVLNCYKRNDEDKILTKTMINNYTKDKILPPPNKKKYSKGHSILLIIIYHLKSILSISDISNLLFCLTKNFNIEDLSLMYEIFFDIQQNESETIFDDVTIEKYISKMNDIKTNNTEQINHLVLVFILTIRAELEKRLAEKIIDKYFSKPSE